jgi:hypothetical protein
LNALKYQQEALEIFREMGMKGEVKKTMKEISVTQEANKEAEKR